MPYFTSWEKASGVCTAPILAGSLGTRSAMEKREPGFRKGHIQGNTEGQVHVVAHARCHVYRAQHVSARTRSLPLSLRSVIGSAEDPGV